MRLLLRLTVAERCSCVVKPFYPHCGFDFLQLRMNGTCHSLRERFQSIFTRNTSFLIPTSLLCSGFQMHSGDLYKKKLLTALPFVIWKKRRCFCSTSDGFPKGAEQMVRHQMPWKNYVIHRHHHHHHLVSRL